jgi:hypothetical protein
MRGITVKPTTFGTALAAVLTLALSTAGATGSAAAATTGVDGTTAKSFGRIADALLAERTAALLDTGTRRPLRAAHLPLSAGLTRSEDAALSTLRARKSRLAALGEA